jgi:hypothetical protein
MLRIALPSADAEDGGAGGDAAEAVTSIPHVDQAPAGTESSYSKLEQEDGRGDGGGDDGGGSNARARRSAGSVAD